MRDEQVRETEPIAQIRQQVDDRCLDRHVQRGYRLIADYETWLSRERARNCDALTFTTAELMWVAQPIRWRQAHHIEQFLNAVPALMRLREAEQYKWPFQRLTDRESWVQRRTHVLEHDLRLLADGTEIRAGDQTQISAIEFNTAVGVAQQSQRQTAER